MTVRVIIVENPLDSRDWEDFEVEAAIPFMMKHFRTWPGGARIYDMDGVGLDSLLRAGELLTGNGLAARDVTPRDEAGVDRLGTLNGPLVVAVAPADPITAIIAVVAVIVAVVATLLLMPKMPTVNNSQPSANNTLAGRSNTARPGSRIEDIFGTVRSIPSLLQVPYRTFLNNLELEIAYMCVGRGSYDLADVRDGDTALSAIAGAAAHFYGPDTSPNFGDTQLSIGTPIDDPVLSVSKVEAVNGQILRPPNANFIKGDGDIRFVAPDTIQSTGSEVDFTTRFATDDVLTVGNANFGGQTEWKTLLKNAKFYPDKTIVFDGPFDPTTVFIVGQQVALTNAVITGLTTGGVPVTVDLSGNYVVASVNSTTLGLV
jgi:hypothetical protein